MPTRTYASKRPYKASLPPLSAFWTGHSRPHHAQAYSRMATNGTSSGSATAAPGTTTITAYTASTTVACHRRTLKSHSLERQRRDSMDRVPDRCSHSVSRPAPPLTPSVTLALSRWRRNSDKGAITSISECVRRFVACCPCLILHTSHQTLHSRGTEILFRVGKKLLTSV